MSVPTSAAATLARTVPTAETGDRMGRTDSAGVDPALLRTSLFPPRNADPDTRAAWLARSPWPEVVFASAH